MKLELTRSGEGARLVAGGRLTASVSGRFRDALLEAFSGSRRVELALRGVEETDLTFLQLLCAAHRSAASRSVEFAVTGLEGAPSVCRLVREAGVARDEGCPDQCVLALGENGRPAPTGGGP